MVVLFLIEHFRFIEKRSCAAIAGFNQLFDGVLIDSIANDEEPVLIERPSLLFC